MERFSHRESVLLGYSPQKPFMNSSSQPESSYRNSDIDFNDVFGGPPRRSSSMQETRYSLTFKGDDDTLSGLSEKPVFGEEGVNRRGQPSQDFFDDIFKGNEYLSSSPKKHDRDPFSSGPGSRVSSPARPLPPKAELFGSSLPAHFSFPAKLTEAMDLPIFGSSTRSRFSSQVNQGQDDSRNEQSSYRQRPLFQELSLSSEESSNFTKSHETDTGGNAKMDSSSSEVPINGGQFHFSIYKWASKGVPLLLPPKGENSSRLKAIKTETCSSSYGWIESMAMKLSTATSHDIDLPSSNDRISVSTESFRMECQKQEDDTLLDTSTRDRAESFQIVEETILHTSDTETLSNLRSTVKTVPDTILQDAREQTKPHSLLESAFSGITEKETSVSPKETQKPELKPLFTPFDNDGDQGIDEITGKAKGKESMANNTKKSSLIVDGSKSIKKQDGKRTTSDSGEVDKARLQGSHANSGDLGKNSVKGKVKDFVKLFNQEASSNSKLDIDSQSQSYRWKERGTSRAESEPSVSTSGTNEKMRIPTVHAKKTMPDTPIMVDDYFKQPEEQHSAMKKANYTSKYTSSRQKDTSASSTASISNGSKATVGDTEESFQEIFMIKELAQDDNKLPQTGDSHEDIQATDTKLRQWSYGKEGNIRSLLSTLQYVLWPESGWKTVPLVDIIEGNAVKRSYQKALLCLHPDKLQQKGAASHQKYIAEKVFDILQEAWTQFNSLGSL